MAVDQRDIYKIFSFKRVIIPILIGVGFSAISLLINKFDFSVLQGVKYSLPFIVMAVLMMAVRDFSYILRIRILTENELGFKDAFQIIMLWEFASSVTPSMIGGSAFAIFFINAEGVKLGKSTAIVLVTALLDELFYILMVALILSCYGLELLRVPIHADINLTLFFFIGYGFIIMLTTIIVIGVFITPLGIKRLLVRLFSLPFLRKWRYRALQTGNELIVSSKELKGKSVGYWVRAFLATAFSWTARYLVLNCLILALNPNMKFHFDQQVMIYAKQLVMWVILLISPTPGASGIAEVSFSAFFANDFPNHLQDAVALLWRAISYYPYLFIGLIVLPCWLKKLNTKKFKIK